MTVNDLEEVTVPLRRRIAELEAALAPFARFSGPDGEGWKGSIWEDGDGDKTVLVSYATEEAVILGDFERAARVLGLRKQP